MTALCFRGKKEEGSSATDSITDVTDVRKKEKGRRKREKEKGKGKREEGKLSLFQLKTQNSKFKPENYSSHYTPHKLLSGKCDI
ncbi:MULTISPECIES: hypothetical protein [unclassified Microcoleus]|uniref:hypothetical protein n=1 Tax=unclassified Microcoleus TaxID=2642155 RepID=UPI002FD23D2B